MRPLILQTATLDVERLRNIESIQRVEEGVPEGQRWRVNGEKAGEETVVESGDQAMPGILKKSGESRKTSEQSKNLAYAKSINMAGESKRKSVVEDRSNGRPQLDGGHDMANGVYTNGNSAITTESQSNTLAAMDSLVGQLPPEIEHITYGYLPFSKLITRLVQDTFNGLTDVITDMSDLQVPQSNHHAPHNHLNSLPNGIATGNSSQANFQKKLRMLDFAQDRRSQFIKILVLSQWSRQAEAIGKVIDLRVWLDGQRRIYDDAANWTGELKRILAPRKMLNPDLKTALEALSLGKASWLPDVRGLSRYLLGSIEADRYTAWLYPP